MRTIKPVNSGFIFLFICFIGLKAFLLGTNAEVAERIYRASIYLLPLFMTFERAFYGKSNEEKCAYSIPFVYCLFTFLITLFVPVKSEWNTHNRSAAFREGLLLGWLWILTHPVLIVIYYFAVWKKFKRKNSGH